MNLPFPFPVVRWTGASVRLIDQTRLPGETVFRDCTTVDELCVAIRELAVRGAPAIGVAAAFGMVLAHHRGEPLIDARARLAATRPTAVNLFWALERMSRVADPADLLAEAEAIMAEDLVMGRAMGEAGQALLPDPCAVLTHCNAGGLATAGYGTALGVVYAAHEAGKRVTVFADETRPLLQGARLTAWELQARGIPVTVVPDVAAATLLRRGRIDAVITGADRIAANGDAANKIGTYPLAVLAARHGVPFYVAAPSSTIDPAIADGDAIPIEERDPDEVHRYGDERFTPAGVAACNPAFDVTSADLIAAIVTEDGVHRPPYRFASP